MIKLPEEREVANLHCHSFYSYNGYGYSPSHLVWLAKKQGIKFMGIVDFDVLDDVDEFLDACDFAGIRGTAGIETRVYIPEFTQDEINSPCEPRIAYHMGTGFVSSKVPVKVAQKFENIRERVVQRNLQIPEKVNEFLAPLVLDYEKDILPLTPAGYATERHMVREIAERAFELFEDPIEFWHKKPHLSKEKFALTIPNANSFQNLMRNKLMKRGGWGRFNLKGMHFH